MASAVAYPAALRAHLPIPADHHLLFGVALGTAADLPVNTCRTQRAPIDANVAFVA
jgi:hypothetical protein